MELRHLRYFVAVAETENVTRAATKLHVSQPALSRQIHDLEDEIGFPLLVRSAKSVRLTEAGRTFLIEARAVLQRAEEAVVAARARAGGMSGEIRVGYAPSLTVQILPQALRIFQAEFPGVRVMLHDLSTEEMLAQLHAGTLQLALMVQPTKKTLRGLRFEELARYPLQVAVAPTHPLAKSRSISLEKVAKERLIGYSQKDYPEYHDEVAALFKKVGRKPQIVQEHDGVTSLIAAVESGRGVALVPSCIACMVGPRLKLIPLAPAGPPIVVGAITKGGAIPVIVEKFIAAARLQLRKP
jgi:LysR family transcriptional regulator, benzoate and cis,cis-muconate-responsive activator of ben and cat genes